jgi:hypothetical protein
MLQISPRVANFSEIYALPNLKPTIAGRLKVRRLFNQPHQSG